MPALTQTQQGALDLQKEIRLEPRLKRKLLTELKTYQQLHEQLKAIESAMNKHKKAIGELRDQTGEASLEVEGFKITLVAPLRAVLDKQKLIAQGVTTAMLEAATTITSVRPYEKITLPGTKESADD